MMANRSRIMVLRMLRWPLAAGMSFCNNVLPWPELKTRILVVDDDQRLRDLLCKLPRRQGFEVNAVPDAAAMDKQLARERYDLVVLDLMLPGEDGLAICRRLRAATQATAPRSSCSPPRATTSIASSASRWAPTTTCPSRSTRASCWRASTRCCAGSAGRAAGRAGRRRRLRSSARSRSTSPRARLTREGKPVPLTTGEFSVLKVLVQHPRQPLSRDKLMELARGREYEVFDRSIDVQISRLRKIVEEDPSHPSTSRRSGASATCSCPDAGQVSRCFARSFLLIAALIVTAVLASFQIYRVYEREPRSRELAQQTVSTVNLTRAALVSADPFLRRDLLVELNETEGLRVFPATASEKLEPLPDDELLERVREAGARRARRRHALRLRARRRGRLPGQLLHRRGRVLGDAAARALRARSSACSGSAGARRCSRSRWSAPG